MWAQYCAYTFFSFHMIKHFERVRIKSATWSFTTKNHIFFFIQPVSFCFNHNDSQNYQYDNYP